MHDNTNFTDISQFSTHLGWRPLCKYLPNVKITFINCAFLKINKYK